MIRHPRREHRSIVLFFAGLGVVACLTFSALAGHYLVDDAWNRGLIRTAFIGCWELIFLSLMSVCGWVFVTVLRRPRRAATTTIHSQEWGKLAAVLAAMLLSTTLFLGALDTTHQAGARASPIASIVAYIGGALAMLSIAAVAHVVWSLAVRGRSRLTVQAQGLATGQKVSSVLEIPFAAEQAPTVDLELEVTRLETGTSDKLATNCIVLRENRQVQQWQAAGPRRCQAEFDFNMPELKSSDEYNPRVRYVWSLRARPAQESVAWRAYFALPIQFGLGAARPG